MVLPRNTHEGHAQSKSERKHKFAQLVDQFQDFAMAVSISKLRHRQDAEDAAQAAFASAWIHLDQLTEPDAFPGWFTRIINTECHRILRKRKNQLPLESAMNLNANQEPIDFAHHNQLIEAVHTAIDALPEHERIVVSLFHIGGYSQKEISAYLDIPVSTVKKRLHDARKRLAKLDLISTDPDSVERVLRMSRPSNSNNFAKAANGIADLIDSAGAGDAGSVERIITNNPSLVGRGGSGGYFRREDTAHRIAAEFGYLEVVELLLEADGDPNHADAEGVTPLISASVNGHTNVTQLLQEYGAGLDIFSASALGDYPHVKNLVDEDPGVVNLRGPGNATPLNTTRSIDIAELLLDNDADIDAVDVHGTLLDWLAARGDHTDLQEFLKQRGAAVDAGGIHSACRMGDLEAVRELLSENRSLLSVAESEAGELPLNVAAHAGQLDVVDLLLEFGADPNQISKEVGDSPGSSPLHNASAMGHIAVLERLVKAGAKITVRDTIFNRTPKQWANFFRQTAAAEYLAVLEQNTKT